MAGTRTVQHSAAPPHHTDCDAYARCRPDDTRPGDALRSAATDASASARRLTKLADCLSGAIEHARSAGLSDAQIADHLTSLGGRIAILTTLAADTDGPAVRFLVASLAAQPDRSATVT